MKKILMKEIRKAIFFKYKFVSFDCIYVFKIFTIIYVIILFSGGEEGEKGIFF